MLQEVSLDSATYAVLDFETTGLSPASERVVELSVVRYAPGSAPVVVLDTLVDPQQPVSGTWIHGITDDDVAGAPTFQQILPALEAALAGAVLVSHNVYFDLRFLQAESRRSHRPIQLPHLCTMYLSPLLGLGERKPLLDSCAARGIPTGPGHHSRTDALATAYLLDSYLAECRRAAKLTFGDLARGKSYKFLKSFALPLLESADREALNTLRDIQKSRAVAEPSFAPKPSPLGPEIEHIPTPTSIIVQPTERSPLARYLDAVSVIVEDLDVTDDEVIDLRHLRKKIGITEAQVRAVHAQIYGLVLSEFSGDMELDWAEQIRLKFLHGCLQKLGWAPGD